MEDKNTMAARMPVSDVECEKTVIGYLLTYGETFSETTDTLKAEYFYDKRTRELYEVIADIAASGHTPDIVQVASRYISSQDSEMSLFVGECAAKELSRLAFPGHCALLAELWQRRRLYAIGKMLMSAGTDMLNDLGEVKDKCLNSVKELDETDDDKTLDAMAALTQLDENVRANLSGENISGVPTGFPDIDKVVGGLHYSDLTIIGAYPGQGKTSLAIDLMVNIAELGFPVAMYSAEMPAHQIMGRMVAAKSGVSVRDILYRPLGTEAMGKYDIGVGRLSHLPIFLDDTARASLAHIIASIRKINRRKGVRFFFIDYLQLLKLPRSEAKECTQLAEAVKSLKGLAKELMICIVLLSQLSRNDNGREPKLERLRGSGEIEEGADNIWLIWRPRKEDGERYKGEFANADPAGTALIQIAKGRNVGNAPVMVGFDGSTTHFYPLSDIPIMDTAPNRNENRPF